MGECPLECNFPNLPAVKAAERPNNCRARQQLFGNVVRGVAARCKSSQTFAILAKFSRFQPNLRHGFGLGDKLVGDTNSVARANVNNFADVGL